MGGALSSQHNRATGKTVSRNRENAMGWYILRFSPFPENGPRLDFSVERPCSPSRHYPRRQTRLSIIDSEEDSSSDEKLSNQLTKHVKS
jgi:hypothetical protein